MISLKHVTELHLLSSDFSHLDAEETIFLKEGNYWRKSGISELYFDDETMALIVDAYSTLFDLSKRGMEYKI